jgi:hypothetical protein
LKKLNDLLSTLGEKKNSQFEVLIPMMPTKVMVFERRHGIAQNTPIQVHACECEKN